jgi:Lon protease-like protein
VELPLFPLSTVLFPAAPIPLHVFEDRYKQLFARVLAGERKFGVVAITSGRDVDPEPEFQQVGCVAEVRQVRPYPDGRMDVVARGGARFRVERVTQTSPYVVAEVAELEEPAGEQAEVRVRVARSLFGRYLAALLALAGEQGDDIELPDDPVAASYLLAAGLQVDLPDKQRLLALPSAAERLLASSRLMRRELALFERLEANGPAPMAGPFSLN